MGRAWRLACLGLVLATRAAAAEPFERAEDQRGVRIGVWRFEPVIAAGLRHDGNIFREPSGGRESLVLTISPSTTLRSDWRRHSIALTAGIDAGFFTASPADNWVDGAFGFEGIVDATRATRLRLQVSAAREHEARGGDDAPLSLAEPVRYTRLAASVTGQYAPGRLRLQPSLSWERLSFRDTPLAAGGVSDQDDRDRSILGLSLFTGWRATRRTEIFAEGRIAFTAFADDLDRAGLNRDNTSAAALIGARLGEGRLLEGRIAAGLAIRRYEDPRLKGFFGPVAETSLTWRPTRLIEIGARLNRRIEETTAAPASGADATTFSLEGRWSVRRFVDLTTIAAFENRRFRGTERRDRTITLGLGAEWSATRGTDLIAGLRHERERSTAIGEDSDATILSLSARHRF